MVGILPWIRSLAGEADLNQKLFEWVLGAEMYVTSVFREVTLENNCWIQIGRLHVVLDAGLWARLFVRGVIRTKAAFHRTDLMEWHYISGSWGGPWISALLLPGLAVTLRQWRRPAPALLAIWFTLAVLLLGILSGFPPQDTHLVVVTPAVALLYAVTIVTVATILATFARAGRRAAIGLAAPAALVFATLGAHEYFGKVNRLFPPEPEGIVWFSAVELEPGERLAFVYSNPLFDKFVPFGVRVFEVEDRYLPIASSTIDDPAQREKLASAEVVIVEAAAGAPAFDRVRAELPGWLLSRHDDSAGNPVAFTLRRP